MLSRLALFVTTLSIGAVTFGVTAHAHIEPDPSEAQAGDTVTVGFTVEHGCDGSPTIEIEMRLADGITAATPEPLDGWDESIDTETDGDTLVVTFTGGVLDPDTAGTFDVTMTLPPTPDATIYFPFVQHCEVGEIRWIGIPDEPGDELDEPAPAMDLIGPIVTTTAPPTTDPPVTTPDATPDTTAVTAEATTPDATTPGTTTATATVDTTPPSTLVESTDTDGDSGTGTIIFIISVLAVFLVGGAAWLAARRARAADGTSDDTSDGASTDGTEP